MEYIGDNKITKSYINGELVTNALKYHKFNEIQYDIEEVRFRDIEFIGEKLKKNSDYNKINKEVINELNQKKERILYIYEKDNKINILTQSSIYVFENSKLTFFEGLFDNGVISSKYLSEYFGIKFSYDFEKEIFNINF